MAVTLEMKRSDGYRILWLKYVDNVDLSEHCMKCLVGVKSKKVTPSLWKGSVVLDESNSDYFYLCGVVYPWDWKNNFHCAFQRADGEEFTYKFRNTEIHVINAKKIDISDKWINRSLYNANNRLYSTCRNWQFANWFKKNVVPKNIKQDEKKQKKEFVQLDLF